MSNRKVIRPAKRTLCIGDLNRRIRLHSRTLKEPEFGEVDAEEKFDQIDKVYASIKTTAGKAFFSDVHGDIAITHEIGIRYRADVSAETWVELGDETLLDIIDTNNLEESNEWLILMCSERGKKTVGAARA